MSASAPASHTLPATGRPRSLTLAPLVARRLLATIALAAAAAGFVATGHHAAMAATANAGRELTHLLRAMAVMKTMFAAGAAAAVYWRLGAAVNAPVFALYAVAVASMAAGPGLIWDMEAVKLGALLLHGGLFATVLLLWRDPAMTTRLAAAISTKRARLAG